MRPVTAALLLLEGMVEELWQLAYNSPLFQEYYSLHILIIIIRLIHNSFIKSYIFITICFIIKEIENIAYNFVYLN
jgi:hypothetical protein